MKKYILKKYIIKLILILIGVLFIGFGFKTVLFLTDNNSGQVLNKFTTDGCSMFPDGDWGECCIKHDKSYWIGGESKKRLQSDIELKECVINKNHNIIGKLMYIGVRIGGVPYFPTSWRWGYGRNKYVGYNKIKNI